MTAIGLSNPGYDGAGIIATLIAPLVSIMLRFFPPVVTGPSILIIGVTLMSSGIDWIFGLPLGPTAPKTVNQEHVVWRKQITDRAAATGSTLPAIPKGLGLAPSVNNPAYASLPNMGISVVVLIAILCGTKYVKGFVTCIAVLSCTVVCDVLAAMLGMTHLDKIGTAEWLALIKPFPFGTSIFDAVMIVTMVLVKIETSPIPAFRKTLV